MNTPPQRISRTRAEYETPVKKPSHRVQRVTSKCIHEPIKRISRTRVELEPPPKQPSDLPEVEFSTETISVFKAPPVVATMMKKMGYDGFSGLGLRENGSIQPVSVTKYKLQRCPRFGKVQFRHVPEDSFVAVPSKGSATTQALAVPTVKPQKSSTNALKVQELPPTHEYDPHNTLRKQYYEYRKTKEGRAHRNKQKKKCRTPEQTTKKTTKKRDRKKRNKVNAK